MKYATRVRSSNKFPTPSAYITTTYSQTSAVIQSTVFYFHAQVSPNNANVLVITIEKQHRHGYQSNTHKSSYQKSFIPKVLANRNTNIAQAITFTRKPSEPLRWLCRR